MTEEEAQVYINEMTSAGQSSFDIARTSIIPQAQDTTTLGDLIGATFRQETLIGSLFKESRDRTTEVEQARDFDPIQAIPDDLIDFAGSFVRDRNQDEVNQTARLIRDELRDSEMIANHPWKSFIAAIPSQAIDPANLLPGAAIYKSATRSQAIARGALGGALSAAGAAAIQETGQQFASFERGAEESAINVLVSGMLGGALGASAATFKTTPRRLAQQELNDVIEGVDKKLRDGQILDGEDIAKLNSLTAKFIKLTPFHQMVTGEFETAKSLANIFIEHGYELNKTLQGVAKDTALETIIKVRKAEYAGKLMEAQKIYFESRGVSGPLSDVRAKFSKEGLTPEQNALEIHKQLVEDVRSTNDAAARQADIFREVFDEIGTELQQLGLLPEGITPKNAAKYLPILYNKAKIIAEGGRDGPIHRVIAQHFREVNGQIKAFKQSVEYKSYKIFEKKTKQSISKANVLIKAEKNKLKTNRSNLKKVPKGNRKRQKELQNNIQKSKDKISDLEGALERAKKEMELARESFNKKIKDEWKDSKGNLFKVLDSDEAIVESAKNTVDTILGDNRGSLTNPALERLINPSSSPFKDRVLMVPQMAMADWHIADPYQLMDMHIRATVPIAELTRAAQSVTNAAGESKGYKTLADWKEGIRSDLKAEFDAKNEKLTTERERNKLRKTYLKTEANISKTIDMLLGIYGRGSNVLDDSSGKFLNTVLTWNATRLLGFMTLSSIPDMGLHVFRNGFYRSIHDGLVPVIKSIGKETANKRDLKALSYGVNTVMAQRIRGFIDHDPVQMQPSPFSKGLDWLSQKFGNLSIMNQWNDFGELMAGNVSINRTLDAVDGWIGQGKIAKKELRRLAQLGIDRDSAKIIYEKTKGLIDADTGCRYAAFNDWSIETSAEAKALRAFKGSISQEIEQIMIRPGLADRPDIAHSAIGKIILQFKSFLLAATNKVLLQGLQQFDADKAVGIITLLTLGAGSYALTSAIRGNEIDTSFSNLSFEAIDRSGVTGIIAEVFNMAGKTGLVPWKHTSRYETRQFMGSLLGPSFGAMEEVSGIINSYAQAAYGNRTLTTDDYAKLMRLMPLQNLFYLNRLNRYLTREMALTLGAEDRE